MGRWGDDDLPTAYFAEALVELLESKPLSAISVSELTQRAGVSRVTFYRNYDSIEEVLERHVASIAHGYEKKASEGRGFASYIREDNILLLADTFREHANLVRCLRKRHAESYLFEAIERGTLAVSLASERSVQEKELAVAYSSALTGSLISWVVDGMGQDRRGLRPISLADRETFLTNSLDGLGGRSARWHHSLSSSRSTLPFSA